MNKLIDILSGEKVLDEIDSPINGRLIVKRDIAWGTYIQCDGITQSGGVVRTVWKTTLNRVLKLKPDIRDVLIIGLGGGDIVGILQKRWNDLKIIGVDLDENMVNLGKKYLGLSEDEVRVEIGDGIEFIKKDKNKYDLICVDTYVGQNFPEKFENEEFVALVHKHLKKSGIVIFNRLYYGEKRKLAEKFEKKLLKEFGEVRRVYPEANLMFICEG